MPQKEQKGYIILLKCKTNKWDKMIQILLLTHGRLGREFKAVAQSILGKDLPIQVIGFDEGFLVDQKSATLRNTIESLASYEKMIVLTDSFGGTPSNMVLPYLEPGRIEIITGINLGLLLFLLNSDLEGSLPELCKEAKQVGKESILVAGEFL